MAKAKAKPKRIRLKPVVVVVQMPLIKYLTFYCVKCKTVHTIAVRKAKEKVPLAFNDNYWVWNGSKTKPTISGSCIENGNCHSYLKDGLFSAITRDNLFSDYRHTHRLVKMIPVADWPLKKPPREKKNVKRIGKTSSRSRAG